METPLRLVAILSAFIFGPAKTTGNCHYTKEKKPWEAPSLVFIQMVRSSFAFVVNGLPIGNWSRDVKIKTTRERITYICCYFVSSV
jgi:hypothetical protein